MKIKRIFSIAVIGLTLFFVGCTSNRNNVNNNSDKFNVSVDEYKNTVTPAIGYHISNYVDPETGVSYLIVDMGNSVSITPRLNPDGTPYIKSTKE